MRAFGLFSGIGGFERSLAKFGVETIGLCEIDPYARSVLERHFPGVPIRPDIAKLQSLSDAQLITAGFPCQDLSQAGEKAGIRGERSSLVDHVFRLIERSRRPPRWVLLENVSYMLRLDSGRGLQHVLGQAESLGYRWAYRTLDARAFGLPQRRERVVILLGREEHPSEVLFPDGFIEPNTNDTVGRVDPSATYGFYWTEGKRGLGWTKNSLPTIKGGSGLGIPSPPAIWEPSRDFFGTPSIQDAERMFGFPRDWTKTPLTAEGRAGPRWKMIGNAVCVPMVDWVIKNLQAPKGNNATSRRLSRSERLPSAAFGGRGERFEAVASAWPTTKGFPALADFLRDDLKPLSHRAATGFHSRAMQSTTIRFADGFLDSLTKYIASDRHLAIANPG